MPIYEYHCKDCGEQFEALQKITAKPLTECRFCSGTVEKLVSNSSFTFKGGGWYITDYKNKSKKKETKAKGIKDIKGEPKSANETPPSKTEKTVTEQKKVS